MAELCGDREDGVGEIDESDIQRFSSSTIFLREWRYYNYEPKTVKFASDSRGPEDKDADISVNLPQFSSAAFLKNGATPEASTSMDFRNFVMYVGGPIWALDWCPQDHERTDSLIKCEYIAVSAHPPCSSYHKMGIPLTGRENRENESNAINLQANENVISEYSGEDTLLCNNVSENAGLDPSSIEFSIPESVALPRVVLCLAHNGKVAWDLKWKPTNACDAKCKHRMGYLAVLLGNGSLEVWEVPFPHVMRAIYSKCNGEGTDPRFVKLNPTFRCSMLRSANKQSIPLTVEWSSTPPYDYLLAGCHDGTVALWKFSANSPCEDTRPLLRFSADTVPIRGVAWAPNDSDPECENVILTAGHGGLKFWDLRDPFRPLWDLHPAPRIIYSLDWLSDPSCAILSFDDGTLRLLSLPKAACDVPVTGKPFTRVKQKGLHTYCCTSTAIWSVQVSRQTGMVAYCGADGTVVRFQLTTKAVVKENSRNRTPQFVCDYFTEEQSTITIHTPELDVPFPLKKMSNRPDPPPLSMRAILSEIQSNEGNHKTAAASLSENGTLAPCSDDDFNVESGSEDTPTPINKKSKTQSKCKKKGEKDNQESECSDEANDVPTNNGGAPGSGDSPENLPPKSVAVHRVRWNMNTGSERWLCYGGAAGLLRCQEILLSALDKKLMMKK
ncbi:General transcription factor 3C polypeptide 2, partial [Cucurbita argyrosperma subsp. sororia]